MRSTTRPDPGFFLRFLGLKALDIGAASAMMPSASRKDWVPQATSPGSTSAKLSSPKQPAVLRTAICR
ncbi:MAG TPA: hypothetical protein VKU01_08745 [Bryobacteraceae bacterium]|nr:hypothetical protein [Bryobacteraceae bacterium]